jgi:DNA-directed RNA polymerase sigma subunit (sigma70/sigma32)
LTREEEAQLGVFIEAGRALQAGRDALEASLGRRATLREAARAAGMAPHEHHVTWLAYVQARQALIQHNLRLVRHLAQPFAVCRVPMPDLMAAGTEGLMRAIDKFDFGRNLKFSTYASAWITSKLQRCVAEQARRGAAPPAALRRPRQRAALARGSHPLPAAGAHPPLRLLA